MKRMMAETMKRGKGKLGEFVSIAVPAVLESMMMVVVASIDTKMISGLGGAAISAVSLTAQPKIFVLSIFFALGTAVSVFVAQARGRGNREEANGYFHSILWVALLLSVVLGSLLAFFAEPVMALCNRQADTMGMSAVFFRIVMGGMIFQTTSIILNAALRGLGKTNITLTSNLALAAVDILFNYLLIEGRCGFPRLEVAGNAFATVLGTAAACLVSLREILYREDFLSLRGFFDHRLSADGRRKTVASRSCADTSASMRVGERLSNICSKAGNVVFENLSTRLGFLITGIIVSLFPAQETAVYFVAMLLLNCCSHFPVALSAPDFLDTVLFIGHDHNWFVAAGLLFREFGVGHDDYYIPGLDTAGCGSVQADDTGSSLARYDIGFQAGTVVVVHYLHTLVGQDMCRLHQGFIYGDAAHVAEVRLRHRGTVDL